VTKNIKTVRARRGRPQTRVEKRSRLKRFKATPSLAFALQKVSKRDGLTVSAWIEARLQAIWSLDEGSFYRLMAYWSVVTAATVAAGDRPELWYRYTPHVPFPSDLDDPEFRTRAIIQVRAAVEQELSQHKRLLERRGEPDPAMARESKEKAKEEAEHRYAAQRYKEIINRRGEKLKKEGT